MGISKEQKDKAKFVREDRKIKPDFAPGQGGNNMGNNEKPSGSPFGGGNKPQGGSPFGGGGNRPQGGSPFGGGQSQRPQGGSPFGGGQNRPQGGSPFGGGGRPQGGSPFGGEQGRPPMGGGQRPPMGGGFNAPPNQSMNAQMNNQQMQGQNQGTAEEKLEKVLVSAGSNSMNFFKEFAGSLKKSDLVDYKRGLNQSFILGATMTAFSLIGGFFKPDIFQIAVGAGFSSALALGGNYFITNSKRYLEQLEAQENGGGTQETLTPEPEIEPEQPQNTNPFGQSPTQGGNPFGSNPKPNSSSPFGKASFEDDDEEDDDLFDDDEEDDDDDLFDDDDDDLFDDEDEEDDIKPVVVPTKSPEEVLTKLDDMNTDMVSRQFIYESMINVLPKVTPDYKKKKEISDSSDKFDEMDVIVSDVFEVLGLKDDEITSLDKYTETLMVDYLEVERPSKKFKTEDFDKELTQILRKGYNGQGGDPRMYSRSEFIGKKMVTNIFKGVTPMISIGDVMSSNKDFYMDSDKSIPLVLGIDGEGKEIKVDLQDAESILISGKPRSGKSFTVRQILTQMVLFNSPSKIQFYLGDVKDATSDYYLIKDSLPHIKRFESKPLGILNMLKNLVEVEAKRRASAFEDAGVIKISDYHDKYPDREDMPYIYVIIDEMVGLASELKNLMNNGDKNTPKYLNIYFGYLEQLVTQLPAYGIRLLAIPHRITNNYIPKTASDNMMFKVAVAADAELLQETLNITQAKFGYKATNKGDLSVLTSLISPDPFYCRSIVPGRTTQESDKIFEFQGQFWSKLTGEKPGSNQINSTPNTLSTMSDQVGIVEEDVKGVLNSAKSNTKAPKSTQVERNNFNYSKSSTPKPVPSLQRKNEPLKSTDGGDGLDLDDIF